MAVGIGALNDRVTIQQKSTVADAQGGRSASWSTLATVWANVRPTSTNETIAAASLGSQSSYIVEIRYRADVTPKMRMQWTPYLVGAAKTLEIHGVQATDGKRERLTLTCGEVI